MLPIIALLSQTLFLWFIVFVFYRLKNRFTLIPLYGLIAILTLATHNLADLGFAVVVGNLFFLISSVTFFTSLMLGVLILYLFEGPRAVRTALIVILFVSLQYIFFVFMLGLQTDTTKWVTLSTTRLNNYFWSISAIIADVMFMTFAWELLGRIKKLPVGLRVFIVILGTYSLDTMIFATGAFGLQPIYKQILYGDLTVRLILALIASPVISIYLKTEGYTEDQRVKPKSIWEILNFRSDLETKIRSMEQILKYEKELEDRLNRTQETYRLALEGTGVGIWDWDVETNVVTYSPKYFALLGYKDGEIGTKIEDMRGLINPDDAGKAVTLIDESKKAPTNFNTEYRLRMKDGSYRWFQNSGITKLNHEGKVVRMVGSIIDIDEKKHLLESNEEKVKLAEDGNKAVLNLLEDLRQEKEMTEKQTEELKKFQQAVEVTTDQIVITDVEGLVLYANPAMERLTGYTRKEALGTKAGTLWGKQMPIEYYKNLWETIKIKKQSFISEIKNKRKNGVMYTAIISISPIVDDKGQVKFFVAVERDITREKELEKMKDEFLNMASHELRTPMTAIKGFVSMILEGDYGKVDKKLNEPLDNIKMATNRLIDLVGDLLSVSRLQAGRLKIQLKNIDVGKLGSDWVSLLQPIAKEKQIKLKVVDGLKLKAQADEELLRQIINNLVGNALKFTEKGGSITLSFKKDGEMLQGEVKDTGMGMAKADTEKLFGRFQQIASQGGGKPTGTGLGLYISRELARVMGGDLWLLKTELGAGTTFAFSLPLAGSKKAKDTVKELEAVEKQRKEELGQETKIS